MKSPAIEGGSPVRKDFLVFGQPEVTEEDIQAVTDVMRSKWLGTGPKTTEFENKFANYVGAKYAVGLNSCTSALHLALLAGNFNPGDEIICPIHTFTATASQIIHAGLKPVFCDVQLKTANIEPSYIESLITPKTKGLVVVHFAGLPCDMAEIIDICRRHNLVLFEDCAHAAESTYNGQHCGTFGDAGCFSFYSNKNMTTCGEGGMLVCEDPKIEEFVRVISLHGMSKGAHNRFSASGFQPYLINYAGFKNNITDVSSAMGLSQLSRLDDNWQKRKTIWEKYNEAFKKLHALTFVPPEIPDNKKHAHHLYILHLKIEKLKVSRNFILDVLTREGIGSGIHYTSLHQQPYYKNTFGLKDDDFPNSTWISQRTISLPIMPQLTEQDSDDVINAIFKVLEYYKK